MDELRLRLNSKIHNIELFVLKTDEQIKELESNLKNYVLKAKETLQKKQVINPKPQKRLMRIICEDQEIDPIREEEPRPSTPPIPAIRNVEPVVPLQQKSPQRESLRPIRTAKTNASKNLKEVSTNVKLRNDNNVAVFVKSERISAANKKLRDSLKENAQPAHVSTDEGMQTGSEPDLTAVRDIKRSMSVEIIPSSKPIQIDITDDSSDKMPPPPIPIKNKKKAPKQAILELPTDPTQALPVRVTRSKIKKEKPSIGKTVSSKELQQPIVEEENHIRKSMSESVLQNQTQKVNDTIASLASKKGAKKKYPLPILVKIERISTEEVQKITSPSNVEMEPPHNDNENIPPAESAEKQQNFLINETVTISTNLPVNETVTLATNVNANETYNKNMHDSLMTEDNDEESSMELAPEKIKENKKIDHHPQLPLKLKTKNEVFNPYLSSPVKQKVQAFEKHAVTTPDKSKATSSKYSTLKNGTPSKIALYGAKTTPLNNAKQKYIAAISGSASSSTTSLSSNKKTATKKYTSLSQESNEDTRKNQAISINQQLEEKRKQREEKQKQVQLQREAIEKQKREQVMQQQRERDEKFRKIMQEKEEAKRMEAQKKKALKENQEKKYAEEKARKDDFALPKEPQSASKDDSLYIKMQKQILMEKSMSQKKKVVDKNTYSFEMLQTDDSTDDESHPSKKRPDPPQWSKSKCSLSS
ncbi:hypothetical protein ACKWTF_000815 [Chironomus riparius]